ncbi:cytochrome P450 oxidoreductase [Apiospora kogelbergensis]|uniref:Cytochrome P450 oxidoreductase n=1 Tax=Apiospora kogelbergensis TaxID=1337665 RepID=A0AAW0RB50_9PEZI
MHSLIYVGGLGILLLVLLLQSLLRTFTSNTRSIPGPRIARLTRLWYFKRVWHGSWHTDDIALHQKYGPVVRVAPGWFSLAGPPDKDVYGIASRFPKSNWYEGWKHPDPRRWTLFSDQDIHRHAATRRCFQSLYSMSALLSYEPYVDECVTLFLERMAGFTRAGQIVDMAHWFQCFAFDVMGHTVYSQRFGFLDRGEDIAGTMQALDKSMPYSTLVGIFPWLHPYLYPLLEKVPGSGAAGRAYLMRFVAQRIADRNKARAKLPKVDAQIHTLPDSTAPRDFLDKLMDAHDKDPERITPEHIFMMGISNIFAGSDTTAISLSSILWHLMTTPESMEKLRKEVDLQTRTQGRITFKTANTSMPYLHAVIKEALRLHPATGLPLWRVVPEGGATVSSQYFEAGSVLGINVWVAHYDRDVYGDDVDVFRPERWIETEKEDPERVRRMEANYMPFGLGSRTCIGRHVSTLEMYKLVPELIARYDFELAMPRSEWRSKNCWFVKPEKLPVKVLPRV